MFSMSTKDLSCLLAGEASQERGSDFGAGRGSDPPNNYQEVDK